MKKNIFYFICIFNFSINLMGQNTNLPKTNQINLLIEYDTTYRMLHNYLVNNKYIEKEYNTIYLVNLLSLKEYDLSDSCGIYVFGLKESHPNYFLFFDNKDKSYLIIKGISSLEIIIKTSIIFFEKNKITNQQIQLFYMFKLLDFFSEYNSIKINSKDFH